MRTPLTLSFACMCQAQAFEVATVFVIERPSEATNAVSTTGSLTMSKRAKSYNLTSTTDDCRATRVSGYALVQTKIGHKAPASTLADVAGVHPEDVATLGTAVLHRTGFTLESRKRSPDVFIFDRVVEAPVEN